ncbi:hypothetical protein [Natronoglycomyces albus]|nr:hypothetical protein [Natronoglycomyces albus]
MKAVRPRLLDGDRTARLKRASRAGGQVVFTTERDEVEFGL